MKLRYTVNCKPLSGCAVEGHAGYSAGEFATRARSETGIVEAMKRQATETLARRVGFYQDYPAARKMDVYDEDHVWHFHTWAQLSSFHVVHFDAFCVKRAGGYGEMEFAVYSNGGDRWTAYRECHDYYQSLVA